MRRHRKISVKEANDLGQELGQTYMMVIISHSKYSALRIMRPALRLRPRRES